MLELLKVGGRLAQVSTSDVWGQQIDALLRCKILPHDVSVKLFFHQEFNVSRPRTPSNVLILWLEVRFLHYLSLEELEVWKKKENPPHTAKACGRNLKKTNGDPTLNSLILFTHGTIFPYVPSLHSPLIVTQSSSLFFFGVRQKKGGVAAVLSWRSGLAALFL